VATGAAVSGRSRGLRQALIDDATKQLDRAVAGRELTTAQRDRILSELRDHVGEAS
jgi:hypothetical protein